jgi:hypothetical protein
LNGWYIAKLKSSVFFFKKKMSVIGKKSEKPRQHAQKMMKPVKKRGQNGALKIINTQWSQSLHFLGK